MSERWPEPPPPYRIIGTNSVERDPALHAAVEAAHTGSETELARRNGRNFDRIMARQDLLRRWHDIYVPLIWLGGLGIIFVFIADTVAGKLISAAALALGMPLMMWFGRSGRSGRRK